MVQESALRKPPAEPLLRAGLLASLFAPALPRAPQFAGEGILVLRAQTTVREKGGQDIHLRAVGFRGLTDLLWRLEAFALPPQATSDDPREDPRQLFPVFLGELSVLLCGRNRHRPRY